VEAALRAPQRAMLSSLAVEYRHDLGWSYVEDPVLAPDGSASERLRDIDAMNIDDNDAPRHANAWSGETSATILE
jgi:hypothetical protein